MNPTTALIVAAALVVVVVVLIVWSAVEAVLWLEDHGRRLVVLEDTLEDVLDRLERLEIELEAVATITSHHHTPWSPLYDQDAPGVWADLTTAEEEV